MGKFREGKNEFDVVNNVLIIDIETYCELPINNKYYVTNAQLRYFGAYSFVDEKYYYYSYHEKDQIQKLIDRHDVIVGFNSNDFDIPIMQNNDYNFEYKVRVDLLRVLWNPVKRMSVRSNIIKVDGKILSDLLPNYRLETVGEVLGLSVQKGDIDYNVFKKEEWTKEEEKSILEYLHNDIVLTKELFEFLYKEFLPLKDFLSEKDQRKYEWMRQPTGTYTYKVVCHRVGLDEDYPDDNEKIEHIKYEGGFVALPTQEEARGRLFCLDYSSAYPHSFFQSNLYSHSCTCCKDEEKWSGNDLFPVKGKYCKKQMGKIEQTIKDLFLQRLEYKKNKDSREYANKIIINCFSPDTEIVTCDGVKLMSHVKVGDYVPSLNLKTRKVEFKKVLNTVEMDYDGEMYHFKDRNKDLLVTPNHNMVVKHKKSGRLELRSADKIHTGLDFPDFKPVGDSFSDEFLDMSKFGYLYRYVRLKDMYKNRKKYSDIFYDQNRRCYRVSSGTKIEFDDVEYELIQKRAKGSSIPRYMNLKDLAYLLGIYISEGSARIIPHKQYENTSRGISKCVQIAQNLCNMPIRNKIKKTLDNLGIKYSENDKCYIISNDIIYDFLTMNGGVGSENKFVSDLFLKQDREVLEKLHEGLYDGDGTKKRYCYTTKSTRLRDNFIYLNLLLGYRCYYSFDGCWRIWRTSNGSYRHCINKINKNKFGKIVCVHVEDNHTVYAGRNGFFHWTGQTLYGVSGSPLFKSLYNTTTASDCTLIARQMIKYARTKFADAGYKLLYTDTDSVYLEDVFDDKERLLKVKEEIVKDIKDNLPFPQETFDMDIDEEMKAMWFFKGKTGEFSKKFYAYLTVDNNLKFKGVPLIKSTCSKVSQEVFKRLKPIMLEKEDIKFDESFIRNKVFEVLNEDMTLAAKLYKVKSVDQYASPTCLSAQISEVLGPGNHWLIPNYKIGIGKGKKKYATLEQAKDLSVTDLFLDTVFDTELGIFIRDWKHPEYVKRVIKEKKEKEVTQLIDYFGGN